MAMKETLIHQHQMLTSTLANIRELYQIYNGYKLEHELIENLMCTVEHYEKECESLRQSTPLPELFRGRIVK